MIRLSITANVAVSSDTRGAIDAAGQQVEAEVVGAQWVAGEEIGAGVTRDRDRLRRVLVLGQAARGRRKWRRRR